MLPLRGTKDILPNEILIWQHIYNTAKEILTICSYKEIRTPILESTDLFIRTIGNATDIVNKEMYTFTDKSNRNITLRPEGTASIARAFITNKLYTDSHIQRLWYFGPMFRYERPQKGRQRQFHQLGIECIGSPNSIADVEVIRLAIKFLESLNLNKYNLEINSIGNLEERTKYEQRLVEYLQKYEDDLDEDLKIKLQNNPLRILDSKNIKIQEILKEAPSLKSCLNDTSLKHFDKICKNLTYLNIPYIINTNLVRGLDYYNYTAFEIKTNMIGNQDSICGGGRYDELIKQIGGPKTPSVGWAIGLERLILSINDIIEIKKEQVNIYLITQGDEAEKHVWKIIEICEKNQINFELELNNSHIKKQIKKASQSTAKICIILGEYEINNNCCTIKWLNNGKQKLIDFNQLDTYLKNNKKLIVT